MSPSDETELHRLCDLLASVDQLLPESSPAREGVQKAALALHLAFMQGSRSEIEQQYFGIDLPLTEEQLGRLAQLGIVLDR